MYGDALDREICARVAALARERNTTMAAVALAWVLSKDDICCPIVGASTARQVENNGRGTRLELTAEEIAVWMTCTGHAMSSTTTCRSLCRAIGGESRMDNLSFDRAAMQAVNAVREIFQAEVAKTTACAEQLGRVLALMTELRPNPERAAPRQFPGCRHLERTLELAETGPAAAVAAASESCGPISPGRRTRVTTPATWAPGSWTATPGAVSA